MPVSFFKLFRGSPSTGNAFAIERSVTRSAHLEDLWPYFVPFCNELRLLCGWRRVRNNAKAIMYNLLNETLTIQWIFKASYKNISYLDDSIKKDEVIWGKKSKEEYRVGRVLFIIRVKGLRKLVNINGTRLFVGIGVPNEMVLVGTNVWVDQMNHEKKLGNLMKYWQSLPIFREFPNEFSLWQIKDIFQKVAYRHAHVLMPPNIWNIVWRKGTKDMRHREGVTHKRWKRFNKHPYLWGLEVGKKTRRDTNYWCGIREICIKHNTRECRDCFKDDSPTKMISVCLRDYRWVVVGIAQGKNNKFTSGGSPE